MATFFILGAGASVDSGLPTFRGDNGYYSEKKDIESILSIDSLKSPKKLLRLWKELQPLYSKIQSQKPGRTYEVIKQVFDKFPQSYILNQNIDLYPEVVQLRTS